MTKSYDEIPIAHVLNYVLADGFDASGESDVRAWLGQGKTIADMLGQEASDAFYTPARIEEIAMFIHVFSLKELEHYLNNDDRYSAVRLTRGANRVLVFYAGDETGTPAITTDWFARHRASFRASQ